MQTHLSDNERLLVAASLDISNIIVHDGHNHLRPSIQVRILVLGQISFREMLLPEQFLRGISPPDGMIGKYVRQVPQRRFGVRI